MFILFCSDSCIDILVLKLVSVNYSCGDFLALIHRYMSNVKRPRIVLESAVQKITNAQLLPSRLAVLTCKSLPLSALCHTRLQALMLRSFWSKMNTNLWEACAMDDQNERGQLSLCLTWPGPLLLCLILFGIFGVSCLPQKGGKAISHRIGICGAIGALSVQHVSECITQPQKKYTHTKVQKSK